MTDQINSTFVAEVACTELAKRLGTLSEMLIDMVTKFNIEILDVKKEISGLKSQKEAHQLYLDRLFKRQETYSNNEDAIFNIVNAQAEEIAELKSWKESVCSKSEPKFKVGDFWMCDDGDIVKIEQGVNQLEVYSKRKERRSFIYDGCYFEGLNNLDRTKIATKLNITEFPSEPKFKVGDFWKTKDKRICQIARISECLSFLDLYFREHGYQTVAKLCYPGKLTEKLDIKDWPEETSYSFYMYIHKEGCPNKTNDSAISTMETCEWCEQEKPQFNVGDFWLVNDVIDMFYTGPKKIIAQIIKPKDEDERYLCLINGKNAFIKARYGESDFIEKLDILDWPEEKPKGNRIDPKTSSLCFPSCDMPFSKSLQDMVMRACNLFDCDNSKKKD